MIRNTLAVAVLALSAAAAHAGDFYMAADVGYSHAKVDQNAIDKDVRSSSMTSFSSSVKQNSVAYGLSAGYAFNKYIAAELGYVDLGKMRYTSSFIGNAGAGSFYTDYRASGFTLSALGSLPVTDNFNVYGRLGLIHATVKAAANGSGFTGGLPFPSASATSTRPLLGIGASYSFNQHVALRAELTHYDKLGEEFETGRSNVDVLGMGLIYKF